MALAKRTVTEALRVFAPRVMRDGLRHAPSPASASADDTDQMLAVVDRQTITGEPSATAVLVDGPAPMLLDTLRFDVTPEEWHEFAESGSEADARDRLRVGALRGGVLVALATASRPLGQLSRLRVLVNPAFRQIGLGHLVLHRAVQQVLRENLLPYATFVSTDLTARALARAVGFVNLSRGFGPLVPAY